ncbi:MAG: glycosyltransferase family 39 protein [Chloroflexota bacterium]
MSPKRATLFLILILLLAFGLRLYQLTDIPPGLTHDEANHGREAIEVLDGVYRYFFPLNYGSEPLYSYTVAASMRLLGENLFALRYVNVVFGLLAISISYVWATWAFDRRVGLLTAVLITLSFWPLASSRQALRAGMLPFFTVAAALFFWKIAAHKKRPWLILLFSLSLVATFHIYLAARVAWLIFPIFLAYLAWLYRPVFKRSWQPIVGGLLLAGLLVIPMFVYLRNQPESQTRLGMLDAPLAAIRSGDFTPVFQSGSEALLAFIWPGFGDQFLAYNIPGRPVFDVITAVFFIIGLATCFWKWKRASYTFVLLWFFIGILPSLITGATANTTRNLAALPAVFMLPAIGFMQLAALGRTAGSYPPNKKRQMIGTAVLVVWLLFAGATTFRDYFITWAQSPDVRGAYQRNLAETITYWDTTELNTPIIFSSVYPGPAHDTSIATVLSNNAKLDTRWVDARQALILPPDSALSFFIPASTPPHPAFAPLLAPIETINLRPTDLDPSFVHYQSTNSQPDWLQTNKTLTNVDNAIHLLHAQWLAESTPPGGVAELLTVWRVADPTRIGPLVPPAYTSDVVLFTHVLNDANGILVQRDSLDAPAWSWQTDDIVIQIHSMWIAPETAVGTYPTITGFYDLASGERRPVVDDAGQTISTHIDIPPLLIAE